MNGFCAKLVDFVSDIGIGTLLHRERIVEGSHHIQSRSNYQCGRNIGSRKQQPQKLLILFNIRRHGGLSQHRRHS